MQKRKAHQAVTAVIEQRGARIEWVRPLAVTNLEMGYASQRHFKSQSLWFYISPCKNFLKWYKHVITEGQKHKAYGLFYGLFTSGLCLWSVLPRKGAPMTLSRKVKYRLRTHQGQLTEARGPDFLPDSHLRPEVNPAVGHTHSSLCSKTSPWEVWELCLEFYHRTDFFFEF